MPIWSRRSVLLAAVARLFAERTAESPIAAETGYRADAVILLFGIPIFTRKGVGSGIGVYAETMRGEEREITLEFSAGSDPKAAKGLNRYGSIREVVVERMTPGRQPIAVQASYFGFMTSSPEESREQAQRVLNSAAGVDQPCTTVEGSIDPTESLTRKTTLSVPSSHSWRSLRQLTPPLQTAVRSTLPKRRARSSNMPPVTFLYSVIRGIGSGKGKSESVYSYMGDDYRLRLEQKPDPAAGRRMHEAGLTRTPDRVMVVQGLITNLSNDKKTQFRLWRHDGNAGLPLRIEYHARAFLKLIFEQQA